VCVCVCVCVCCSFIPHDSYLHCCTTEASSSSVSAFQDAVAKLGFEAFESTMGQQGVLIHTGLLATQLMQSRADRTLPAVYLTASIGSRL